ncbi:MAG: flavodoxin family protein [Rhodobacteraceae bacterium]|nr:flavodoxin family protein [Paracoccaceae bacterium]
MKSIAITYCSGAGHTERLAELIAEGAETIENVLPVIFDVETLGPPDWQALDEADAIVFGAPTYMGSVATPFKAFMDESGSFWREQSWADKIAAGFTIATYPSGDKLASLQQLAVFTAQHGMIWIGQNLIGAAPGRDGEAVDPTGSWLGLGATSSTDKTMLIDPEDAETARAFGRRIALAARRWQ